MLIALICKEENLGQLVQHPISVTGSNEPDVAQKAIAIRDKLQMNGNGPYQIYIGNLCSRVETTAFYRLAPL